MTLTKDDILSADDIGITTVDVPEWGGSVCVRDMSGTTRDQIEAWTKEESSLIGFRAMIVAQCLCDETGASLGFTPSEVQRLGDKSARAIERIVDVINQRAGYTREEVAKIEGNLPSGQSDNSGCD